MQIDSACYWLGMRRRSRESSEFVWMDGSDFEGFFNQIEFDPMPDLNPTNNRECVCIYKTIKRVIARTIDCAAVATAVCQRKGT